MDTDDEFLLVSILIRVVIVGSDSSRNSYVSTLVLAWHDDFYCLSFYKPCTQVQMMYII